ncbi:hypothetical protein [Aquabacterium sp. A7-Y]|uniref:hypothetical protein n=1 Tax=Aquabacterium sp. A7-Y TaxID=1349605 RepID=UPI0039FD705D
MHDGIGQALTLIGLDPGFDGAAAQHRCQTQHGQHRTSEEHPSRHLHSFSKSRICWS